MISYQQMRLEIVAVQPQVLLGQHPRHLLCPHYIKSQTLEVKQKRASMVKVDLEHYGPEQ